jgi:hypothetical protein
MDSLLSEMQDLERSAAARSQARAPAPLAAPLLPQLRTAPDVASIAKVQSDSWAREYLNMEAGRNALTHVSAAFSLDLRQSR